MKAYDYQDYQNYRFKRFEPLNFESHTVYLSQTFGADKEKQWVPYYHFKIKNNERDLGHVNFRAGYSKQIMEYDGHIGYEILPAYRGNHLSLKATKALLPFIYSLGFHCIVLTCAPHNIASMKIIQKLGAVFQETKSFPHINAPEDKEKNIYFLNLIKVQGQTSSQDG